MHSGSKMAFSVIRSNTLVLQLNLQIVSLSLNIFKIDNASLLNRVLSKTLKITFIA